MQKVTIKLLYCRNRAPIFRLPTRVSLLWFLKHPQCMTHYVLTIQKASSSTCVPFPQCKCTRMKHYTPNRNVHPQCISQYTPNGNVHPQCNGLCLERVYRAFTVPCFLCSLLLENNGGKGDAHHFGIRRAIADVPTRT